MLYSNLIQYICDCNSHNLLELHPTVRLKAFFFHNKKKFCILLLQDTCMRLSSQLPINLMLSKGLKKYQYKPSVLKAAELIVKIPVDDFVFYSLC